MKNVVPMPPAGTITSADFLPTSFPTADTNSLPGSLLVMVTFKPPGGAGNHNAGRRQRNGPCGALETRGAGGVSRRSAARGPMDEELRSARESFGYRHGNGWGARCFLSLRKQQLAGVVAGEVDLQAA